MDRRRLRGNRVSDACPRRTWLVSAACATLLLAGSLTAAHAQLLSEGPNSPGASFNDVTFGTVAWTNPGNATADGGGTAQAAPGGGSTNYLHANNFNFNIPTPAVIEGIEVTISRSALGGTIKDSRLRIVKGGVVSATEMGDLVSTWPMVETPKTYGSNSDLWGETWTAADINAATFGVVLSVTDAADLAEVDHITATVYYSLCPDTPVGGCRTATKSLFIVKDKVGDDTKDKIIFKWIKGMTTTQAEFQDPTSTAIYATCVYENGALSFSMIVPFDNTLWSTISTKGYKYKDTNGAEDGVTKILLKGLPDNKSKILVKGKGTALPDPVPPLTLPVQVQVINSDNGTDCWDATFAGFKKNQAGLFKGKNPP